MSDRIKLRLPLGRDWVPVVRMVLGGIGSRLDFGLDELDDVQLAVERLLDEAPSPGEVEISFDVGPERLRIALGPLRESAIAAALQGPDPPPGQLTLRRVLDTLVDSFGVEQVDEGGLVVRLEKLVRRAS